MRKIFVYLGKDKKLMRTSYHQICKFSGSSTRNQDISFQNGKSFEENVFEMYKSPSSDKLNVGQLLTVVERTGIRRCDLRLKQMMTKLTEYHKIHGEENTTLDNLNLDLQTFSRMAEDNSVLLSQTIQNKMIIPDWQPFCQIVKDMFLKCKKNSKGNVASYIPQLAKYSTDNWGVSICTIDGQRFSLGDVNIPFTLQSCSKPFTYATCLQHLGHNNVHKYIGYEPSGRNFNEICLDRHNKPHNPMLNGGAIMSCALILNLIQPRSGLADKYDFLYNCLHKIGGYEFLGFNNSVFLSERSTADRNFSMGYYMKEHNCFPDDSDLHEVLDLYFQSCSLEINTETLAVMGATLANGGVCPTTGENVLNSSDVRDVLSLMYSSGMYNYSGEFAFKVGLPAKSGVSGAILLVVPNVMCVALWSPPLDSLGNSVRGIDFCNYLVDTFKFHQFDDLKLVQSSDAKVDPRRSIVEKQGQHVVTVLFAAVAGDTAALQRLHLQNVDMCAADYDGRTALHLAAAEGHLECVRFLLDICDVSPCPVDRWGHTPLQEAERGNHASVVEFIKSVTTE